MAAEPLEGLSWSWDLDLEALLAAVSEPAPWSRGTRPSNAAAAPDLSAAPASPASGAEPTAGAEDLAAEAEPAADDGVAAVDPVEAELAEYLEAVETGRSSVLPENNRDRS